MLQSFKIRIVAAYNIVHGKIPISSTTDILTALIVAVSGVGKYSALEDLRIHTFTYGQEVRLSQLAIEEATIPSLEPGYGHIAITTTSSPLPLVEVNAAAIQRSALGATHSSGVAIRERHEPPTIFLNRMNQYEITTTHLGDALKVFLCVSMF